MALLRAGQITEEETLHHPPAVTSSLSPLAEKDELEPDLWFGDS